VSLIPLPDPFTQRLGFPPVLAPVRSDSRGDHYEITQRVATAEILPGVSTTIWGYEGMFPGPTIESRSGQPISVTYTNELPVPTVVHLHGGRTPPEHDGYPIDLVLPVGKAVPLPPMVEQFGDISMGTRTHWYPLEQPAATLWYHDHRMDFTGPGVWKGLAGFHIIRDDEEDALGLPSGPREMPLMILDRSFGADGSLLYPAIDPSALKTPGLTDGYDAGVLGDVTLVNGVPWPTTEVEGARYRLRLLNASNARRYDLRLDPAPPDGFVQIGTDGGLLVHPLSHDHIEMAPAQRFDVVVDFAAYEPGTVVTLLNDFDSGPMAQVMQFVVGDRVVDASHIPDTLTTIEPLDTTAAGVITRTMRFNSGHLSFDGQDHHVWLINGEPFTPNAAEVAPVLDSVEIWQLVSDFHHPVHVHLNPFQVLSRGIDGPGPYDAGWKDTIDLRPFENASIAVRFDGFRGRYVFHCHNLEHEDMAMMANFIVT
jgi:spore coat protein A